MELDDLTDSLLEEVKAGGREFSTRKAYAKFDYETALDNAREEMGWVVARAMHAGISQRQIHLALGYAQVGSLQQTLQTPNLKKLPQLKTLQEEDEV